MYIYFVKLSLRKQLSGYRHAFLPTKSISVYESVNLYQARVPFLYFLKTLENHEFSDVSSGYKKGKVAWN